VDDAAGEGQGIEPGHGGGVAGEHAGIVGDGGFTREGTPHAGGGLLRELEAGSLYLARQQQEGYEGGLNVGCMVFPRDELGVHSVIRLGPGFYMV
jgi:hypothetical protein